MVRLALLAPMVQMVRLALLVPLVPLVQLDQLALTAQMAAEDLASSR
jgi:hypothetical protein